MAVGDNLPQLPLPGPSQLEILFRRMLLQCMHRTQLMRGQADTHHGSLDWRTDPKFHCIVESLQERLYDLEQSEADRPSPDVLQLYRTHVKALTHQLRRPDLPAYCLKAAAKERLQDADAAGAVGGSGSAAGSGGTSASALLQAARSSAQRRSAKDAGTSTTTGQSAAMGAQQSSQANSVEPSFSLSSKTQEQLRTQQRLQDELTSELLDMGQELKASTLAMQNAIRYRGKLLDEAEVALVDSTANAQAVSTKAKQQYKQGGWNFCQTLLILLAVAVIFSGMIIYIKVTSMIGLKGR